MKQVLSKWLTNGTKKPFYARKEFKIEKSVESAEITVCGLGQFNLYINGKKVSDHVLDPAWTDYRKEIQYVVFDVKGYLQKGKNVVGIEVGNGWFIKDDFHYTFTFPRFMPPNPNQYVPFSDCLMFAMKMKLHYEDHAVEEWEAGEDFQVCEHPVTASNVYGSEYIDGAKKQPGWNETGFSKEKIKSEWSFAKEVAEEALPAGVRNQNRQTMPPVKIIRSYEGKFLHALDREHYLAEVPQCLEGGSVCVPSYDEKTVEELSQKPDEHVKRAIYDFGQNMSFLAELEVKGKKGDIVYLYPAEKLTVDGDVDQIAKGWCTVNCCLEYQIGKDDTWEKISSSFAYLAGRYLAIEVRTKDQRSEETEFKNIQAHAITSAWEQSGSFSSDDDRYDKIYDMIEKTVEANMVSVHTDCPTIERFAWQEPNHLMAPAIMYMKNGESLWKKFFSDMRNGQHCAEDYFYNVDGSTFPAGDGLVPSQAPCYIPNAIPVPGMGSFYDIIPWGSSSIIGVYWHYQFYGDQAVIEENFDMGLRYLNYLRTKLTPEGFINHGLGDWGNPEQILVRENIETAFLYADTVILKNFAEILGKKEIVEELEKQAEELCENYNRKLLVYNEEKKCWCYKAWDTEEKNKVTMTQAAEALPLYWGMVPEEYEKDVVKAFRFTLEEKGTFVCGEVGLPYVIQCARMYGMNELISEFIMKEQHPSYFAFVKEGETTLGEYWETNPRSHCHDMMGHIIEWYYNGIAGIIPEEPGFKKVKICPFLPKSMNQFSCKFWSRYGEIAVDVKENQEKISVMVRVPEEIECQTDLSNLECRGKIICLN